MLFDDRKRRKSFIGSALGKERSLRIHHRGVKSPLLSIISKSAKVARWFIFKPKIQILANLGGPHTDGKTLLYFLPVGILNGHFDIL
jgi:hypothetical protein